MAKLIRPLTKKRPAKTYKKISMDTFKSLETISKVKKKEAGAKVAIIDDSTADDKSTSIGEFGIFGIVNRSVSYGSPVFTNDILDTQRTIDPKYSLYVYRNSTEDIVWKNIEIVVFGITFKFPLPEPKVPKKCKIVNDDLEDFIYNATSQGYIIDDRTNMFWRQFVARYDAVTDGKRLMFVEKEVVKKKESDMITMQKGDYQVLDKRYMEYIAKKEFLDGKFILEPMSIKGVSMPIGQTYTEFESTKIHGGYASTMRRMAFEGTSFYKKSGRAFQTVQYEVMKMLGWVTAIVMPRRTGKTFLLGELMKEEMFRDRHRDDKPIRIIYVGINRKKNKTVKDYIMNHGKQFTKEGWFMRDEQNQRLTLVEHTAKKQYYRKGDASLIERAYIDFVGARDESPGIGDYADLIVIDECERIPKEIFDDLYALVVNEYARLVLISTLNQYAQKTWFYDKLIKGEKEEVERKRNGMDIDSFIDKFWDKYELYKYETIDQMLADPKLDLDEMRIDVMLARPFVGIRYSGWQVERWTPKEQEAKAKALMEENYQKYLAEWESIFPEEIVVFDAKTTTVAYSSIIKKFDWILFSYDVADEGSDNKAVTVWTVDMDVNSSTYRKMIQLGEKELEGDTKKQVPQIDAFVKEQLLAWTKDPMKNNYYFIYDGRGVGTNMDTLLRSVNIKINAIYYANASQYFEQERNSNKHHVGKQWIVSETQDLFKIRTIIIPDICQKTLAEIDTFQAKTSEKGYTSFEAAQGKQDGFVNTMLMAAYFILEVRNMRKFLLGGVIDEIVESVGTIKSDAQQQYDMYLKDQKKKIAKDVNLRKHRLENHIY